MSFECSIRARATSGLKGVPYLILNRMAEFDGMDSSMM
jgi:hypothetical protein